MEAKKHQPALTVEKQIDNLRFLGLKIEDETYAKNILNTISYFRLIKAYGIELKKENGNFCDDVTFEQIVQLYYFNSEFRHLLIAHIEQIEITLRCQLANYFSVKYGVLGYEDAKNFNNSEYHNRIIKDINNEIEHNSKSAFVRNFTSNYDPQQVPFYALTEILSFGTLSKFYKSMQSTDKKAIANFYGVGYTYLESWIEHIAYVRNICAHYGRLYNFSFHKTPKLYKEYVEAGISNSYAFATIICIKHMLPHDENWDEFLTKLKNLFILYNNVDISKIGFPIDWKKHLTDKALATVG